MSPIHEIDRNLQTISPGNSTAEWLDGSIAMKHGGKKGREGRKKKEQVVNFTRERDGTANYSINSD